MRNENDITTIFNPRQSISVVPNSVGFREHNRTITHHDSYQSVESGQNPRDDLNLPAVAKKGGCCLSTKNFKKACCSRSAKKIYYGVCVTVCITATWVVTSHCIKYIYHSYLIIPSTNVSKIGNRYEKLPFYNAPFFTTWFCTNWLVLVFPIYYIGQLIGSDSLSPSEILCESIRNFKSCHYSAGKFLVRSSLFCMLWVTTNFVYIYSLRILLATDVMALYATNVVFVYLLSWVILHEQFVGLRIVAIILCNTGVALLAYMDGISRSPTLTSVLLATGAGACSAVYKVMFKRLFGDVTFGQVALFLSLIGMINASLLWPLCLVLYFTGAEVLYWDRFPWPLLLTTSVFSLLNTLLLTFSVAVTYNLFVTLALITSVPVSAALDIVLYGTHFYGMKLAGIILIAIGFFLVMFPDNWPDYITRLLRSIILMSRNARWNRKNRGVPVNNTRIDMDYRTGYIRSHLRSPSGRVR